MYKKALIALLALISLTGQADDKKVTFVVDEGLEPIVEKYRSFYDGEQMAKAIRAYNTIASSFADAKNLRNPQKDAFYQSVLEAYKKHKSLVLSPDMMWLLISQGFARYVNAHSEEIRPQLVDHEGQMDLAIETEQDLFSGQADYAKLVGDFASEIEKYTKNGIAETLTANFSTTTPTERIASQITLMESVKSYFEYVVMSAACGIPTITLKGTPADWQRVLEKTQKLAKFGLADWTKSLEPILMQFVLAAEGKPDQRFWQSIVMKEPIDRLKGGGCSNEKPTFLNGWFLKLFPDENGQTLDSVFHEKEMPSERVCVGFKYRKFDPEKGIVTSETPMELIAGFIGAEEDTLTNTLTPQIGWLIRKADKEEDMLADLQKRSEGYINLKVEEVPEMLTKLQHINGLDLTFTNGIVLPEWFSQLDIKYLNLRGKLKKSEDVPQILSKVARGCHMSVYNDKDGSISYLHLGASTKSDETPDIKSLSLYFDDSVQVPEWVYNYSIGQLYIKGKPTRAERRALSKTLKKANIRNLSFLKP